jgi:hypothetical protein
LSSQFLIATNTAADCHQIDAVFLRRSNRLAHEYIDNRLLKRCAQISKNMIIQFEGRLCQTLLLIRRFTETPYNLRQQIAHGRFQPAKTQVLRVEHAARQIKAIWIPAARVFFDLRSAGIS